jgi:hydroxypyruvate isomerase
VSGLKLVAKFVEERRVTLCLEIVSERHFPGYYCNRTQRAVDICRELGSPAVKVLFDIYHVQNTEGSIIENLTSNLEYIGHVHTAGVPGRHELSDDQELNYRAIVSAIKAAGYRGFVGHELQPSGDADAAFSEAARICR